MAIAQKDMMLRCSEIELRISCNLSWNNRTLDCTSLLSTHVQAALLLPPWLAFVSLKTSFQWSLDILSDQSLSPQVWTVSWGSDMWSLVPTVEYVIVHENIGLKGSIGLSLFEHAHDLWLQKKDYVSKGPQAYNGSSILHILWYSPTLPWLWTIMLC